MALCTVMGLAAVAAAGVPLADEDSLGNLYHSVQGAVHVTRHLRWPYLVPLVLLALLHYWCAAVALQAAAGSRLPLRRRFLAQLAAAAANRIRPAGLGAAAVNARFLSLNTELSVAASTSTVVVLAVIGSAAICSCWA